MPKREWEEKLAFYDGLIEEIPEFERKGKSMAYTSANGYMFSQLNKAGEIGIRLSKADQEEFAKKHELNPFLSYGAVMREYILVPDELWKEPETLRALLRSGYEYVCSLEPK